MQEIKYHEHHEQIVASNPGQWILLNGVSCGTAPYQRIGNAITMVSIELNYVQNTDTGYHGATRLDLVLDMCPHLGEPSTTQYLINDNPWSPCDPTYMPRFVQLYSYRGFCGIYTPGCPVGEHVHEVINLPNIYAQFMAESGMTEDFTYGALYAFYITELTAQVTPSNTYVSSLLGFKG